MTVSTVVASNESVADGVQTEFFFNFYMLNSSNVGLFVDNAIYIGAYTINVNADQDDSAGGSIVFVVPPALGEVVKMVRDTVPTQTLIFNPYTRFPAKHNETGLDKLTLLAQEAEYGRQELQRQVSENAINIEFNANDIAANAADIATNAANINNVAVIVAGHTLAIDALEDDVEALEDAVGELEAINFVSDDSQVLTITPPTLSGSDITFSVKSNTANGLLKLDGDGKIDPSLVPVSGGNQFAGADPTLFEPSGAIILGTDAPIAEPQIAIGPTLIQGKATGTTSGPLNLNALGGDVELGSQGLAGSVRIYQDGNLRISFNDGPFPVGLSLNGAGGTNTIVFNELGNTVNMGHVGFLGSNLYLNNAKTSGLMIFSATDSGGLSNQMLSMDANKYTGTAGNEMPSLTLSAYWDGVSVVDFGPALVFNSGPFTTTMDSDRIQAGGTFHINKYGSDVALGCSDITAFGSVELWNDGLKVGQTDAPASGGLLVNNLLTGAGLERVLTSSDLSGLGTGDFKADGTVPMTGAIESNVSGGTLFLGDDYRVSTLAGFPSLQKMNVDGVTVESQIQLAASSAVVAHESSSNSLNVGSTNVSLVHAGNSVATSDTPANGGLLVNNQETGAGFERVLTESDKAPVTQSYVVTSAVTVNNIGISRIVASEMTMVAGVYYRLTIIGSINDSNGTGFSLGFRDTGLSLILRTGSFLCKTGLSISYDQLVTYAVINKTSGGATRYFTLEATVSSAGTGSYYLYFGQQTPAAVDTILNSGTTVTLTPVG